MPVLDDNSLDAVFFTASFAAPELTPAGSEIPLAEYTSARRPDKNDSNSEG